MITDLFLSEKGRSSQEPGRHLEGVCLNLTIFCPPFPLFFRFSPSFRWRVFGSSMLARTPRGFIWIISRFLKRFVKLPPPQKNFTFRSLFLHLKEAEGYPYATFALSNHILFSELLHSPFPLIFLGLDPLSHPRPLPRSQSFVKIYI